MSPRAGIVERILWIVASLLLVAVGFFFLAAALIAGVVIAAVVLARAWWLKRKLGDAAGRHVITTEYTVVERESQVVDRLPYEGDRSSPPEHDDRAGGRT